MDEQGEGPAEQEGTQDADGDAHCGVCAAALPAGHATACCECEVQCCPACGVTAGGGDVTLCRACAMPVEGEAADATARAEAGTRGEVVEVAATVAEWA